MDKIEKSNDKTQIDISAEELIKFFEDPNNDINIVDKLVSKMTDIIENTNEFKLETTTCRAFLDSASSWILKNFSSPKLNLIINLISILLNRLGYTIEIRKEGTNLFN